MSDARNAEVVLTVLRAIEERDLERLPDLYHPDIAFHWPPGLPYGGTHAGPAVAAMSDLFRATWEPLQPTPELRRMDPEVAGTRA